MSDTHEANKQTSARYSHQRHLPHTHPLKWFGMIALSMVALALPVPNSGTRFRHHPNQISQPIDTAAIDRFIGEQMSAQRIPGLALAITQGERVLHVKGYGTAGNGQPVTPQTQFLIASLSKSFTAVAVMQLVEAGQIELDAPIQRYLPEFTLADANAASQITVRQLLNQVSGLSDRGYPELQLPQPKTSVERIAWLSTALPIAAPGSEYHYFNPNYQILARLVEVASGTPLPTYLQTHIFAPLHMTHTTSVMHSDEIAQAATQLAQGHLMAYGFAVPSPEESGYLGGSGGVISTAEDMARYLGMQANAGQFNGARLVSPASIATMHTPPTNPASPYAMGWLTMTEEDQTALEHNGVLSTFYADMVLLPDSGYGIALLYNLHSLDADLVASPAIKRGVIALLTGRPPPANGLNFGILSIVFAALTVLGGVLAVRSMLHLPRWLAWAHTRPLWQLLPGIVWAFVPAVVALSLPALTLRFSDRAFGFITLFRSMIGLMGWLSLCGLLGAINGFARIGLLIRQRAHRTKPHQPG